MNLGRTLAIAHKEILHLRRDPTSLVLALVVPIVLLLLFGTAISFDLDTLPVAVVDQAHSQASRGLIRALFASGDLSAWFAPDVPSAFESLRHGDTLAVLVVPPDHRFGGAVQLLVDGTDGTTATNLIGKVDILATASGLQHRPPTRLWMISAFNPAGRSPWFIVPGLAAYVIAIVCVLLTSLTVAREIERGSMEQLLATPVGTMEVLVGKLLPYLGLGSVAVGLVVGMGHLAYDVPFRGSVGAFLLTSFLFVAGALGQGLLISTVTRSQMVATQVATLSSVLPSLLLSGFMFPIENMPPVLQGISYAVPARYYIEALRGVLLRGNGLDVVWPQALALLAFAALMLFVSAKRFRRETA